MLMFIITLQFILNLLVDELLMIHWYRFEGKFFQVFTVFHGLIFNPIVFAFTCTLLVNPLSYAFCFSSTDKILLDLEWILVTFLCVNVWNQSHFVCTWLPVYAFCQPPFLSSVSDNDPEYLLISWPCLCFETFNNSLHLVCT